MKQEQRNAAVLYVRVATDLQADGLSNLKDQEQLCRDYCDQRGWPIDAVFSEPVGSHGGHELRRMLDYCKVDRNRIRYAVVRDLSRFGRQIEVILQSISELERVGVLVRSTCEGNKKETVAGRFAACVLGVFDQFFSDALSDKLRDRKRQAVTAGRFPWPAPIGYRNIGGTEGANIEPDDKRAPLVQRAFELIAAGLHGKAEALTVVTDEGLTTRGGTPLSARSFDRVLKNPIYAGWVTLPSDTSVKPVRGLHEPIVSQETFDRVQVILDNRKLSATPKRKVSQPFPLRGSLRCEACGTGLFGSLSGNGRKVYRSYRCPNRECRFLSKTEELRVTPPDIPPGI